MDKRTLEELKKKIVQLPPLSNVVTRLLSLNSDSDTFFEDVMRLAQEDPTFALRIIKLSNSAINTPVDQIIGIREAVVRIGTNQIAGLIASMAMTQVFIPTTKAEKDLWKHSIQVAVISRVLACATTTFSVNPEQAYLCGLIHDVGKFILSPLDPTKQDNTVEKKGGSAKKYILAEKDSKGFNHAILGMYICKKWQMPDTLCNVARYHHANELPKEIENDVMCNHLIRLIQLADIISFYLNLNPQVLDFELENVEECLEESCIKPFPGKAPLRADELATLIGPMILEANMAIKSLGISD